MAVTGNCQLLTSAIDAHVQDEQRKDGEGPAEVLTPVLQFRFVTWAASFLPAGVM
jgi:hypothetical protein